MNILHVTPAYYPATFWGGPIFSTKMICDEMARRPGMAVSVLTTDSAGLRVRERVAEGAAALGYPVTYTRRVAGHSISPGLLWRLPGAIRRADVVHVTSTYNFPVLPAMALARLLGKPVVWSPRGAILATEDWADSPRRRLKRAFQWLAYRLAPRRLVVHVTAENERLATARALPGAEFAVIPNAVDLPPMPARPARSPGDPLRLMFLSRLHPKKGLERLLAAMAELPPSVTLDICGSGEPAYVASLQRQAEALGGRVRLHGEVQGDAKARAFAAADLFVLPSFSENFGIVIAEALAHGLPVLTTTATPWPDLESRGCGLSIDPVTGNVAAAVRMLAGRDLRSMGEAGRAWIAEDYSVAALGTAFAALYRRIVGASAGREAQP